MKALALIALVSCGWAPSNLEEIKARVWASTVRTPQDYSGLRIDFTSVTEARSRCSGNAACYDSGSATIIAPAYLPNCGPLLALELTHFVLHSQLGVPDHDHRLNLWAQDFTQYRCEE